mmetsp:Transcript_115265/g.200013  ORF Transcript_115265/g.200013 Transcript_115265/m.200013 type:complete len:117 (+) Transcript_115265:79-429(+)
MCKHEARGCSTVFRACNIQTHTPRCGCRTIAEQVPAVEGLVQGPGLLPPPRNDIGNGSETGHSRGKSARGQPLSAAVSKPYVEREGVRDAARRGLEALRAAINTQAHNLKNEIQGD